MGGSTLATLFTLVVAIIWILVPFAIFGVRRVLGELLAEQRRTNALLEQIGGDRIPPPQPEPQPWRAP
ncbi:hypothetical protein [Stenotrophomonas sp.]|uniref:hypothetical protein n=1 Tax=Stenotrophomonas sp. TaxID=69392 RepID=UPI002D653ED5|nr:hypothetical protein [Stenotrophomonas sp.]HYQ22339.1 hypothetical protein [Stenotrophomonas sp.]